jgi:hypothetical protein
MSKKTSTSIVLLLAVVGVLYYFNPGFFGSSTKYEGEFNGNVSSIEGDKLSMHGVLISPSNISKDVGHDFDLTVTLNKSTKYTKREITIPSAELIAAEGKDSNSFNIKDADKKESPGSLADLREVLAKQGAGVALKFGFSKNDLTDGVAKQVTYQVVTFNQ